MIAAETLDAPKVQIPTAKLKLESLPKLAIDCLILIAIGFIAYQIGHNIGGGSNAGGSEKIAALTKKVEEKDQEITKLNKDEKAAKAEAETAKAEAETAKAEAATAKAEAATAKAIKLEEKLKEESANPGPIIPPLPGDEKAKGSTPPNTTVKPPALTGQQDPPEIAKLRAKMNLLIQLANKPNIKDAIWVVANALLEQGAGLKNEELNNELNQLFLSLSGKMLPRIHDKDAEGLIDLIKEKATGNKGVDDAIEGILNAKHKELTKQHANKLKEQQDLLRKKKESAEQRQGIISAIAVIKGKEFEGQESTSGMLDSLDKQLKRGKQENEELVDKGLALAKTIEELTSSIASAKTTLEKFSSSRASRVSALGELRGENTTLRGEIASLKGDIKSLKDGYNLHETITSTNWIWQVFADAKVHAALFADKSNRILYAKQKKHDEAKAKREKTEKEIADLRKKEAFLEELYPERGDAYEVKSAAIGKSIALLETGLPDLQQQEGKLAEELQGALAEHEKALMVQEGILKKIDVNEKILNGWIDKPVQPEVTGNLIVAINTELSNTTNSLGRIQTRVTKYTEDLTTKQAKLKTNLSRKKILLKNLLSESPVLKKEATQELAKALPLIKQSHLEITDIENSLKDSRNMQDELSNKINKLQQSLTVLKPKSPPPPPNDLVLVPQGGQVTKCEFVIKKIPDKPSKDFLKAHQNQVALLQSAAKTINLFEMLKAEDDVSNGDKEKYDNQIQDIFAGALAGNDQLSGTNQVTYKISGHSGKLIIYGIALAQSGAATIYVHELDSKPAEVPLHPGVGDSIYFLKKK